MAATMLAEEMCQHKELAAQTGFRGYFADPNSHWQHGIHENPNGTAWEYLYMGRIFGA